MEHSVCDLECAQFQLKVAQKADRRGDFFEAARRLNFLEEVTAIYQENTGAEEDEDEFVCVGHHPLEEYGIDKDVVEWLQKKARIEIALFYLSMNREFPGQDDTIMFRGYAEDTGEPFEFFGTDEAELAELDVVYQRTQAEEQTMSAARIARRK